MAALMPGGMGGGGGGQTMYFVIQARDRTGPAFDRVNSNLSKLADMTARTMSRVGSLTMSFATLGRVTGMMNDEQARAIGIFGTVINIFGTAYYAAKTIATAVTWAHNAALTWEVALLTLGVGVAIAAASAMAVLAMQTNKAADAQKSYNNELERGTSLQRRGASQKIISRSGYTEILD